MHEGGAPGGSAAGGESPHDAGELVRALAEAREQQAAAGEILRVIARTRGDAQPVFDIIAERAQKLCDAECAVVSRFDGERLQLAAITGVSAAAVEALRARYPLPLDDRSLTSRTFTERAVVHVADVNADARYDFKHEAAGQWRGGLAVPMQRGDEVIGAIFVGCRDAGLFPPTKVELLETFADQAVIAIENVRLFNEIGRRNRELTEALEQQTATGEILGIISRSPTDTQPVFDTMAKAALELCGATAALVTRLEGGVVTLVASANLTEAGAAAMQEAFPMPVGPGNASARAIHRAAMVAIPDVLLDAEYEVPALAVRAGFRSVHAVPLMRDGRPIGTITIGKAEPGNFSASQVSLLQIFADQAVIAVENVRQFNELQRRNRDVSEALEHQTATAEILRVISQSPDDVQPVFDVIGERAARLCDARVCVVSRVTGDRIDVVAIRGVTPEGIETVRRQFPMTLDMQSATARAVRKRSVEHIADVLADPDYGTPDAAIAGDWRSCIAVPMFRGDEVIGAIFVAREIPERFPDGKIELLETFADQAVIAIENVRLFNATKEALEREVATGDVLKVISRSAFDLEPVLATVLESATRLCGAQHAHVMRYDGERLRLAASHGGDAAMMDWIREHPLVPGRGSIAGVAAAERRPIHWRDVLEIDDYRQTGAQQHGGFRTILGVPMLKGDALLGVIVLWKTKVEPFSDKQVELVTTFADQAVIAIENVRLFNELERRTQALDRSVNELRALDEVGQAVASSLDLETVLQTIVARASPLTGTNGGSIWEYDEAAEVFRLHATHDLPDEVAAALRDTPIRKGEGVVGRLAVHAEPVVVRDIVDEASYQSRVRAVLVRHGYRAILAVPLLHDGRMLGGLVINRDTPGDFAPEVVELLRSFATQSALAIQNARLYHELERRGRELEAASRHKSEFLANMSHELRTPLNAILGFSELLSERIFGEINEKQAEYLNDIQESGRHLLALINDILDLSKIEAGRMELELSDFDLPSAIENTLILVRERAQRRGIRLDRAIDGGLGAFRADERKLKQVMLNLLSNALKFTPEGGSVDVRARMIDGGAEISVTDTGVGIAPEDQAAVFEEFRQVGASAKKVEGTGLGLAISRKFVELHGGRIGVTSAPGQGSTFAFTLPMQR